MDGSRFDGFVRTLTTATSRRRTLQGVAGGAVAGLLAHLRPEEASAACIKPGKRGCQGPRTKKCCGGARCQGGTTTKAGKCVCPRTAKPCGARCIPRSACCPACPSGHRCQSGACCVATSAALAAALEPGGPAIVRLCPDTTFPGPFVIDRSVTVLGAGTNSTILDGGGVNRVVRVRSVAATVELRDLKITNGHHGAGAGIENAGLSLTLTSCLVTNNIASDPEANGGGGILNLPSATVTLVNTAVTENTAPFGGGIVNGFGTVRLQGSSRVAGNTADGQGGGVFNFGNVARLELQDNAIITDNDADPAVANSGGGIYNNGGTVTFSGTSQVTGNRPNQCTGTPSCPS